MSRLVLKFGGTSVGDVDRIRNVAAKVKAVADAGNEVAVVVSAMAGTTDQLVGLVRDIDPRGDLREYDVVVSAGEQISVGLLAIALQSLGCRARSWLGWQLPVRCDSAHGAARILGIDADAVVTAMANGDIAVVPGFQGVSPDGRVTTLGRGGSDTSAVALAAAVGADRCDIYTDVDGVYTCDPRIVTRARKLDRITYEEMLEMASQGANVLQTRSVVMALKHRVPIQVLSSFADVPGTLVVDEEDIVEDETISGIAYAPGEAKITLVRVADRPGVAASIFGPLANAGVNVDMIVQNVSEDGKSTDVTFTVGRDDVARALKVIEGVRDEIEYERVQADPDVVKISVIGVGMRSHAGVAHTMFRALAEKGINIQTITTSEIKISVLIAEDYKELALRTLHTAYGLDA
ncbi:MAG: aspartate kinase [Proteobacteria bacterium]|nr:aspartate kinase [Pseudomonadota bacterium]